MGARGSAGGDKKDFENLENGTYPARCIGVIELGTHPNTYKDAKPGSTKNEIMIIFEVSELMEDGRPFTVNIRFNNFLGATSKLTKFITSWRGRAFTDEEKADFHYGKMLEAPALITTENKTGKNDRTYTNIMSISPIPKQMKDSVIERVNPVVDFGVEDLGDKDLFDKIWPWVQKIIRESEEGQAYEKKHPDFFTESSQDGAGQPDKSASGESDPLEMDDDSIPF